MMYRLLFGTYFHVWDNPEATNKDTIEKNTKKGKIYLENISGVIIELFKPTPVILFNLNLITDLCHVYLILKYQLDINMVWLTGS